jgi:uncharacterized protein related to proFAR isomerase
MEKYRTISALTLTTSQDNKRRLHLRESGLNIIYIQTLKLLQGHG